MFRNGHQSMFQHPSELQSYGIAQVKQTSMNELIYGHSVALCLP